MCYKTEKSLSRSFLPTFIWSGFTSGVIDSNGKGMLKLEEVKVLVMDIERQQAGFNQS